MRLKIEEYLRTFTAAAIGAFAVDTLATLTPSREGTPHRLAPRSSALVTSLFASALIAAGLIASASVQAALLPDRIAKAAQDHVEAGEYPALVIGYVDGGKTEVDAFGKLDDGNAPDANTVFEIGSITKTFTATLLAREAKAGKLKLDEPVASLLPGFKIPSRNDRQITLLDLADQHSGLPRLPTNLAPSDNANPYADYDGAKLKTFLAKYELTRDAGQSYEYSNLGVGLLGFALAARAHKGYGALLDEKIFAPLGMTSSGVAFSARMRAHLAAGHDEEGKPAKNWDFDALAGCGAIRSSTTDMLRYLQANMGRRSDALGAAMKFAQEPRRDIGKDSRIGLAWMTLTRDGTSVIWHNGGTGGYRSFLGFTTDGKRGVVIMTNIAVGVDELGIAALVEGAPLTPAHKLVNVDTKTLDDFVGTYRLGDNFLLDISRKDDQLFAQASGQGAFPIFASAPNVFFARVAAISITFERDAQVKVTGLVLHQNGDRRAPKLSAGDIAKATSSTTLDDAVLQNYVGQYQLAPGVAFDVTVKDHQLYVQLTGQPAYPVRASAKDRFFYTIVDAQLDFERDAKGAVVAVTLHQNGQSPRAPRVKP